MTTVYYNFPEIGISLQGTDYSKEIQLPIIGQLVTNIQINETSFIAYSATITSINSPFNKPDYLVMKCYADVHDLKSKLVYFAIPLNVSTDANDSSPPSDIDNIMNPPKDKTIVNLTLNNYIKNSTNCVVPLPVTYPLTITLDKDSAIPLKQYAGKTYYSSSNFSPELKVDTNVSKNKNSTLSQKDLDWIMDCELLTEDGKKTEKKDKGGSTGTTISLLMMALLISSVAYLWGPILYGVSGIESAITNKFEGNHYAVNIFIGLNFSIAALMMFSYGASTGSEIFKFVALSIFLSYFAGTSGILTKDGISNSDHTGFEKTDAMFAFYNELITLVGGFFPLPDVVGKKSGIVFLIMILVLVLGLIPSLSFKNDIAIFTNLTIFMVLIFATILVYVNVDKK